MLRWIEYSEIPVNWSCDPVYGWRRRKKTLLSVYYWITGARLGVQRGYI
jgi:hypothetical protein